MRSAWNSAAASGPSATPLSRKGTSARLGAARHLVEDRLEAPRSRCRSWAAPGCRRSAPARRRPARGLGHLARLSSVPRAAGRAGRRCAPSSSTTWVGLCCASRAGRRGAAARRGVAADAGVDHRGRRSSAPPAASPAAAPSPRRACRPYSAERESPTTRITLAAGPRAAPGAGPCTLHCRQRAGRDKVTSIHHAQTFQVQLPDVRTHCRRRARLQVGHRLRPARWTFCRTSTSPWRAQETAAIVGASGSGKSTLLSIIAGLDTPTRGTRAAGRRRPVRHRRGRARRAARAQGRLRVPELPAARQPERRSRT